MFRLQREGRCLAMLVNEWNPRLHTGQRKFFSRLVAVKDHCEMRMLKVMFDFLEAQGYIKNRVASLCHDGIMVPRRSSLDQAKLNEMAKYVEERTCLSLSFVFKQ